MNKDGDPNEVGLRTVPIAFRGDGHGVLSRHCPTCKSRFRIRADLGDPTYCPYCESEEGPWLTPEQEHYCATVVHDTLLQPILAECNSRMPLASTIATPPPEVPLPRVLRFPCCEEAVEHEEGWIFLCCICCGKFENVSR